LAMPSPTRCNGTVDPTPTPQLPTPAGTAPRLTPEISLSVRYSPPCPFGNAVVDLTFTSGDPWKSFEGIVSKIFQFNGQIVTSFVQVSKNIKFRYNPAAAVGSRLVELFINGKPLSTSDTTTYKISTWDFLASGGDNFWPKRSDFAILDTQDEVFVAYSKQSGPLTGQLDGRISTV